MDYKLFLSVMRICKFQKKIFRLSLSLIIISNTLSAQNVIIEPTTNGTILIENINIEGGDSVILNIVPEKGYMVKTITGKHNHMPALSFDGDRVPSIQLGRYYSYKQLETYYGNKNWLFFGKESGTTWYYAMRKGSCLTLKAATREFMDTTIWRNTDSHGQYFIPAKEISEDISFTRINNSRYSFVMSNGKAIINVVFDKKLLGDVNGDGYITMADANMVVNYFLATDKPEGFDTTAADVNEDGYVTMADANQIVNMFLGANQ